MSSMLSAAVSHELTLRPLQIVDSLQFVDVAEAFMDMKARQAAIITVECILREVNIHR